MLSEKGKYASATENRRFVWKEIVWPLILEINDVAFTLEQYQKKRDLVCTKYGLSVNSLSRDLREFERVQCSRRAGGRIERCCPQL